MNDLKSAEQQSVERLNETKQIDPINESIETLANLHLRMERKVGRHQKAIESVTATLGRPRFLYVIMLFVALWILINIILKLSGMAALDPPPFYWLQGTVSMCALLMTTIVLITQNRQNRAAEQRRQLDLQVNLLAEQKVTKVISLIEELRRDSSVVKDRHDSEAEALQSSVDPHEVLASLNKMIKKATEEEE
jgi:uncharacterized membrane protein